jgi:hypothetical protein
MMRSLVVFCMVSVLHFVLSVAGTVVALPAAPLALLPPRRDFGYPEIAAVSVLFGLAGVAIAYAVARARRASRRPEA